jgi:flagellar biosynthesis chaperone FliJ|tara:strand:+ start:227 stop:496 length:270 start_codon:yes stop_codon:yes gene_type:complete
MKYIVDEGLIDEAQSSISMAEDECGTLESAVSDIQSYIADASGQLDDMKSQLVNEQESSLEQFLTVLDSEIEDFKYRVKSRLESELGVE